MILEKKGCFSKNNNEIIYENYNERNIETGEKLIGIEDHVVYVWESFLTKFTSILPLSHRPKVTFKSVDKFITAK